MKTETRSKILRNRYNYKGQNKKNAPNVFFGHCRRGVFPSETSAVLDQCVVDLA